MLHGQLHRANCHPCSERINSLCTQSISRTATMLSWKNNGVGKMGAHLTSRVGSGWTNTNLGVSSKFVKLQLSAQHIRSIRETSHDFAWKSCRIAAIIRSWAIRRSRLRKSFSIWFLSFTVRTSTKQKPSGKVWMFIIICGKLLRPLWWWMRRKIEEEVLLYRPRFGTLRDRSWKNGRAKNSRQCRFMGSGCITIIPFWLPTWIECH